MENHRLCQKKTRRGFCRQRKPIAPTRSRLITPTKRNSRQRISKNHSKNHPLEGIPHLHASLLGAGRSLLISRRKEETPFPQPQLKSVKINHRYSPFRCRRQSETSQKQDRRIPSNANCLATEIDKIQPPPTSI